MDWSYLAGFTDGDGTICISKDSSGFPYPLIDWSQAESNIATLEAVRDFLISCDIPVHLHLSKNKSPRTPSPMWTIRIMKRAALKRVLLNLQPYLVLKKKKATIALDLIERMDSAKEIYGHAFRKHVQLVDK